MLSISGGNSNAIGRQRLAATGMRRADPLRIVGTSGSCAVNATDVLTVHRHITRVPFYIAGDVTELRFAFDNWYLSGGGSLDSIPNTVEIIEIALEQDSPAATVALKFKGAENHVMAIGETQAITDPIYPAAFDLEVFPENSKWWLRIKTGISGNGRFPECYRADGVDGAASYYYATGDDIDQIGDTGLLQEPEDATTENLSFGPTAVLGRYVDQTKRSYIGAGDSLTFFNAETSDWPLTGPAWFKRASVRDGVAVNVMAQTTMARGGATGTNFAANYKALSYLRFCTDLIGFFGANDIGLDGDGDLSTFETSMASLFDRATSDGVARIYGMTLWPRTDSSDDWETSDGQTYRPEWTEEGKAGQFDQWLYTQSLTDVFDMRSWRDPSDRRKWLPGGGVDNATHPPSAAHAAIAAEFREFLGLDS